MHDRDDDRFLDEAVARGLLTRGQADDCRRVCAALSEVDVALTVDEVLARKGVLARERSAELRRSLARQRVGRYEVIERLGEGGSGVVWKARDVVLDRIVALKLLSREARDDPAWRDRFLREARTAVTLQHPGLVRGLDCGESDGYLWFTMEYVPGETVGARLTREGRLPERDAVRIALEVVQVLRYVADLGIAHRDLKPENLLLAADGRVKVCDLGLAKPTREEADRVGAESLVAGTPLYVAPEQIKDGGRVDWRADVYALGATLYHMLAGRPPFPWERGRDVLQRHLREVPASPREFALDVSAGAAAVVLKMLQKDPADRYATLGDLESDLESVRAGRPPVHTLSFAPRDRPAVDVAAARAAAATARTAQVARPWAAVTLPLLAAAAGLAAIAVGGALLWPTRLDRWAGSLPPAVVPRAPSSATTSATKPPEPTQPHADPPRVPAPDPAATEAFERARTFADDHPDDLREARDRFAFVVERYPGTPAAALASDRIGGIRDELARRAEVTLVRARAQAAASEAAGRIGEAARVLETFAAGNEGTPAAESAAADARRLRAAAEERFQQTIAAADASVRDMDFDAVRERLEEASALEVPGTERAVALRRAALESAERTHESERASTRAAFERLWGAAVVRAGTDGASAAFASLDEAEPALPAWSREIGELRIDLHALARNPSPDPSLTATSLDLRTAFFARLARRDLAGAESLLARLESGGGRADDLRAGLRRVRAFLVGSADDLLAVALRLRGEGRLDEAAERVARAQAEAPGHLRARVVGAAILADRGRLQEAVAELESVLAQPSPPAEAHLRLGQALTAARDSDARALSEIDLFLTLAAEGDPLRSEAQWTRETLQARHRERRLRDLRTELAAARDRSDHDTAIATAESILALDATDAKTLVALGDEYAETGRVHDAYLTYRRVTDESPYEREGPRAAAAIRRLERRWVAAPQERDAVASARARLGHGDVAEAREAFDTILVRAPFHEDALAGAAEARLARKGSGAYALADDPERALRLTRILVLRNPQHVRGRELRAEALLRTGAAREALEMATGALAEDPLRPDPAVTAGFACLALDDPSAALDHFAESLRRRRTPRALYGRALANEELGRRRSARDEAAMLVDEFGVPEEMRTEVEALLARLDLEAVERPR